MSQQQSTKTNFFKYEEKAENPASLKNQANKILASHQDRHGYPINEYALDDLRAAFYKRVENIDNNLPQIYVVLAKNKAQHDLLTVLKAYGTSIKATDVNSMVMYLYQKKPLPGFHQEIEGFLASYPDANNPCFSQALKTLQSYLPKEEEIEASLSSSSSASSSFSSK